MRSRRQVLGQAAALALAGCGGSRRPPNIVLIMADDLGYRHLGSYGQRKIRTPRLDRMAAEGMRFTDAYAGCTVCAPSRSALMTGLHTGHTPVRGNDGGLPLPAGTFTMARMLREAGYATGIFGKWGLGEMGTEGIPTRQGFDEALGPLHQIHAQYYYPEFLWHNEKPRYLDGNRGGGQKEYAPDVMHRGALDFMGRHRERPFFLYVPSIIPHHEYQVPEDSLAEYRGKFPEQPFERADRGFAPQPHPVAAFAGMVTRLDRHVGEILDRIAGLGLEQRTLVLFTSDNGVFWFSVKMKGGFGGRGGFRPSGGDFQGIGDLSIRCGVLGPWWAAWTSHRPGHRLDESRQVIPRHGCVPAEPASVSPDNMIIG